MIGMLVSLPTVRLLVGQLLEKSRGWIAGVKRPAGRCCAATPGWCAALARPRRPGARPAPRSAAPGRGARLTGLLARNLGPPRGPHRGSQQNSRASLRPLGQPCAFQVRGRSRHSRRNHSARRIAHGHDCAKRRLEGGGGGWAAPPSAARGPACAARRRAARAAARRFWRPSALRARAETPAEKPGPPWGNATAACAGEPPPGGADRVRHLLGRERMDAGLLQRQLPLRVARGRDQLRLQPLGALGLAASSVQKMIEAPEARWSTVLANPA
jgi:hypothetical protein